MTTDKDLEQRQRDKDNEMASMQFKSVRIEFYPEDIEKMKSMSHDEQMDYVIKLRQENRYIEVEE